MPLEDMQIISTNFAGSVIREEFGKSSSILLGQLKRQGNANPAFQVYPMKKFN